MTVESYLNKIEKSITSGTIEENYESTFYTFNNQFSKYFINSLSKDIRRYLSEGSIEMLEKQFYSEIYYLTIRTLIDDFYNWQRVNESVPKEERYHRYCLKLGTVPFFKKIKKAYPVLFIKIFHLHQHTINLIEEAMLSIIRDKDEIKERIGFNFDDGIKEIVLSTGDRHNGGKTAVIFKNNNDDKILYKPHSLNNDVFLENFFSLVNRSLPLKLYHPKSISKKNYGWQEFIEFQECNLDNDYEDYFYRYGELLAIAYALQVTDLHKENIIMSKNYPIVIDSETLFTNPDLSCNRNSTIQNPETVHDLFQKFIKDSVLDTLLLPNNFQSSLFDFDLSPLTNYQQLSENITRFTIENDFSHNIHLKEVHVVLPSSNVKKETNKFYGKIIDGFKACYTILENSKNYFIEEIKLLSEKYPLYLRQVLRPTMVYVKFLEASTHPDYLTDIKKQRKLFQKLNSSLYKLDSTLGKQVEIEINSLMKGDVPYFYTKFNSLSIYSMENKICNFYATSIQSKLLERFQKLGNKDMLKQLHVIFLSLSTVKDTTFSDINQSPLHDFIIPVNDENSLVLKVGDYVNHQVVWNNNNEFCILPSVTQIDDKKVILPVSYYLYDGGGVVLLLYYLYLKFNEEKYKIVADGLLKGFESMIEIETNRNFSAFNGIGSVIYIYYCLFILTSEPDYHEKYKFYLAMLEKQDIPLDQPIDFLGISSLIILLCNIYKIEHSSKLFTLLKKCINYCISQLDNITVTGLAHGYSGVAMSLSYYYEINPSTDILKCIEELLYKEDKFFNNILKNWKDIRRNHNDSFPNFWCYGAPGILLARKEIFDKTNIGNNDLSIIENVLTNVEKIRELNLCHGSVGTISCLDAILKDEENLLIKESIDFYFDNVVSQVIKPELSTDLNTMNTFSFMLGVSGVVYEISRKQDDRLLNVLLLELKRT
ncbi:TPA: type 2 lanthipeptide synthetase LanM family protein [Streptococcus pneumoniae]